MQTIICVEEHLLIDMAMLSKTIKLDYPNSIHKLLRIVINSFAILWAHGSSTK
jgi:hypothetical protein